MADSTVLIAVVRPSLLGTYGDGGNALVLQRRLQRRGIAAEIAPIDGTEIVPSTSDIIVLGGGEDAPQVLVAGDGPLADSIRAAVTAGATVLGVCAGFQLLGTRFDTAAGPVEGLGVLDCRSERRAERAVGEVVVEPALPGVAMLTGFENHRGGTILGPDATPLGRVVVGTGNGFDDSDGAIQGRVIATYLHGPVLARNPDLADHLLTQVTGPLPPLADEPVRRLRDERLAAAYAPSTGRRWLSRWRHPSG